LNRILLEELSILHDMGTINKYYQWLKDHPETTARYRQGRAFEYATMAKLRSLGYYCVRKFGSKGFEDVVALKFGKVAFIQCKHSKWRDTAPSQFDLSGLLHLAKRFGALPVFAGVRKHRMYFMVYDGGWKEWCP